MRKISVIGQALLVCLAVSATVWGQAGTNTGAIAGTVRDSSGAAAAGVAVEVSSPALLERVRDTVTSDEGLYRIVNLPPGVYSITFTLNGFNTVKRDGIEISTAFTATIDASMTPGSVQQTITVSTESPVLDTQDTVVQKTLVNTLIEELPLGKSANVFTAVTPGAVGTATNQDVGGIKGENTQGFRIHGSAAGDYAQLRDGMFYGTLVAAGNFMTSNNPTAIEEIQLTTSGYSAEDWNSGGHANVIPKNGGNDLHGAGQFDFGDKALQWSNITPAIAARGVSTPPTLRTLYEVAGGVGGALKKDKLWFFVDWRHWVSSSTQANNFFDANETAALPNNLYYRSDLSRPAYDVNTYMDAGLRLTWQASKRNKFGAQYTAERNCNCYFNIGAGTTAPEATGNDAYKPDWRVQGTWTFPASNKLLLWAGVSFVVGTVDRSPTGSLPNSLSVTNASSNNYIYGAAGTGEGFTTSYGTMDFLDLNENFTASYITGPHSFKFGYTELQGRGARFATWTNLAGVNGTPNGVSYTFACTPTAALSAAELANDVPVATNPAINSLACPAGQALLPSSITQFLAPYDYLIKLESHAMFGQDQWRIKRLTLNLGLRFDWFTSGDQPQTVSAQPQYGLPARSFAAQSNVTNWKDLNPRIGAAYDVFGNGKTAIKASFARAALFEALGGLTTATNPANTIVVSTTRQWTDTNGDFKPTGDFTNPALNGELGKVSNTCFYFNNAGCAAATNIVYDPDVTSGWMNRPYNWELSAQVQQQIANGFALSFGYYRTWYGNFAVSRNTAINPNNTPVNPANFVQECGFVNNGTTANSWNFTAPANASLPAAFQLPGAVSGSPICVWDIPKASALFGKVANEVERASIYGKPSDVYNGIDVIANARFHGLLLQGGITAGSEATNYCFVVNSPEDSTYTLTTTFAGTLGTNNTTTNSASPCAVAPPWSSNLQVKLQAVYTLPWWKIRVSGSEQNLPSIPFTAVDSFTDPNSATGKTSVQLVAPNTVFREGRNNQTDIRIAKDFTIRERWRIEPTVDFFNLFNAHSVLATNTTVASTGVTSTCGGPAVCQSPGINAGFQNVTTILGARLVKFGVHFEF